MGTGKRILIEKPLGQGCFACGTANPIGLNLQFYLEGRELCSDITLARHYQGWENMAHGGILSTILDEVMSWSIIAFKRVFCVTRKMEVKYIKPALVSRPLKAKGRLVEGGRAPRQLAAADVLDENGAVLARARGEYVELAGERLTAVPQDLKDDMVALFKRLEGIG